MIPPGTVRVLARASENVAESPTWLPDTQTVAWVDMEEGAVCRLPLEGGDTRRIQIAGFLGAVAPTRRGGWIGATGDGVVIVDQNGVAEADMRVLSPSERMNDAKCDPLGRLWAGSVDRDFAPGAGALHVFSAELEHRVAIEGLTQPNGLGWSPDGVTFYLIDSQERSIDAFDFDVKLGTLSKRRRISIFTPDDGFPDGLTVDAAGDLWVALWGGASLRCLRPDGVERLRIDLPLEHPTSCAFVGPHLDQLVVTSENTSRSLEPLALTPGPRDGDLLLVASPGARGAVPQVFGTAP